MRFSSLILAFAALVTVLVLYGALRARDTDDSPRAIDYSTEAADSASSLRAPQPAEGKTDRLRQDLPVTEVPLDDATTPDATDPATKGPFIPGPTTEPERENWVRERRWEYLVGNKDAIELHLDMIAKAETAEELFNTAKYLSLLNVATILGMRGHEEYMKAGVKYPMKPPDEHHYVFGLNYWRYEFHEAKFPEHAYFSEQHGANEEGRKECDLDALNRVIQRAEEALKLFDD